MDGMTRLFSWSQSTYRPIAMVADRQLGVEIAYLDQEAHTFLSYPFG